LIALTFAVVQSWPVELRAKYVCFALTSRPLALPEVPITSIASSLLFDHLVGVGGHTAAPPSSMMNSRRFN
jgi:hypothetical protein